MKWAEQDVRKNKDFCSKKRLEEAIREAKKIEMKIL